MGKTNYIGVYLRRLKLQNKKKYALLTLFLIPGALFLVLIVISIVFIWGWVKRIKKWIKGYHD